MKRIQRQRTKGWRMPPGAIYVGRPTKWGNPWPVGGDMQPWLALSLGQRGDEAGRRASVVIAYRWWLTGWLEGEPFPVPTATPGPGDIEYTDGSTRHIADLPVGMAVMMLGRKVIHLPERPAIEPLRGYDLVCWCPLADANGNPVPCHADVLLVEANHL